MKYVVMFLFVVVVAVGGGLGFVYYKGNNTAGPTLRTVAVERGDIQATVKATGTVKPEELIDVGAQVAGQIVAFGPDPRDSTRRIDFGTPVEKGSVLVVIDIANIERAEADVMQMEAKFTQAEADWKRLQQASKSPGLITQGELDASEAAFRTSRASVAVARAAVNQAKAGLADTEASVTRADAMIADAEADRKLAETNLGYCVIKSPVKGVIIARRVEVGQTVVSSLNSPSLFLIAKDLRRLQISAAVNEADIGQIHSGQAVRFTFDTFPGEVFNGIVAPDQPRLNASMTQNVVTYTVMINTDNSDLKLKPYLTANLEFEVSRRTGVLTVPNAALRWKPAPEMILGAGGAPGGKAASASGPKLVDSLERTVWMADQGGVRAVAVKGGVSDGLRTEVSGDIKEGDRVIVGINRGDDGGETSNPFAPKMFNSRKPQ
ncbi:MAG: efflux RND transporter periplasmic adaptor subunit [Planctomycetes bacterium]|nr:efflux RND transporter periplasmic adaptor subunit [Planctomycetota bacterium]